MIWSHAELPAVLFLSKVRFSLLGATGIREGDLPPENSFCRQVDVGVVCDHNWGGSTKLQCAWGNIFRGC